MAPLLICACGVYRMRKGGMIRYVFVLFLMIAGVGVLGSMQTTENRQLLALVENTSGDMQMLDDSEIFDGDQTDFSESEEAEEGQKDDTEEADENTTQTVPTVRVLLTDQTGEPMRENIYFTFDQAFGNGVYQAGEIVSAADLLSKEEQHIRLEGAEKDSTFVITDASGKEQSLPYFGAAEVYKKDDGYYLVNEVSLESYLYGVVPSEMPSSFSEEALKAQAICARTFACKARENDTYAAWNADLDDSVNSQVYNKQAPVDAVKAAIDQTAGEILTYEGEPIQAYFFSASCGYTSSLNLWSQEDVAYLTEVCLSNVGESIDFDRFIRDTSIGAFDDASPYFRWQADLDLSKLGNVKKIEVVSRANSGAVTDLKLSGSDKDIHITNEYKLRKELGKAITGFRDKDGNTKTGITVLPSAYFSVEQTKTGVTLYGGGYGHGIGLSQYGADGMAKEGYDYREILETFYPGTSLTSIL